MRMNRFVLLALAAFSLVLLAACAPPSLRDDALLKDTSLVTGEPCEAPCWRGITPGETSWRDARTIIEDDPQFENVAVTEDQNSDARRLDWTDANGPNCCRLYSQDGETVNAILLLTAPVMELGNVIERYGEPTYVVGEESTPDEALMSLIYPDLPLVIYAFVEGATTGELTPGSDIIGTIYLAESDMEQLLASTNLYEWAGYDTYANYVDGEFDVTVAPTSEPDANPDDETETTE